MRRTIGELAQDRRLSLRGLGLAVWLLTNWEPDKPITAALLQSRGLGGRDVLRSTLAELRGVGFVTRTGNHYVVGTGFSGSQGGWEPDFQGPMGTGYSGPHLVQPASEPDFQAPMGAGISGSHAVPYVVGDSSTETSSSDDEDHVEVDQGQARTNLDVTDEPAQDVPSDSAAPRVTQCDSIPWTEVHLLRSWFGVEEPSKVEAWQAAWRTGVSIAGEYDPQAHLVTYLTRCREQDRDPSPGLWLRFLVEDRSKFKATIESQQRRQDAEASDGGESWALRSLSSTPDWTGVGEGRNR